jgi:ATP-dependent Clp protease protease subunit
LAGQEGRTKSTTTGGTPIMATAPQVPNPSEVYVSFSAEINVNTTEALLAAMANIANQGVPKVVLCLSSPGGEVMSGMNLYNMLRAMPFELTTHNVGNVDSIANAIFLAGEKRYACPHSTFMFHGVAFTAEGGKQFDEKLLRERLDSVLADQKRIGSILEERSTLTSGQIEPLFRDAQTKDVEYAISAGIVHEVKDVDVPLGTPIINLVFQR